MNQSQLDDAWYEFGPVDWVWAEQLKLDEHEKEKKREQEQQEEQEEQEEQQQLEQQDEWAQWEADKGMDERMEHEMEKHMGRHHPLAQVLKEHVEKERKKQEQLLGQKLMEQLEKERKKRGQEMEQEQELNTLYEEEHDKQRQRWWLRFHDYWLLYEATERKLFDIWQSERAEHARFNIVWLRPEHDGYAEAVAAFRAKTRHIDQQYHDDLDQLAGVTHYELDVRFHRLDIAFRWAKELKEYQLNRNYQIDRKSSEQEIAEFDDELVRINSDHQLEVDYVDADVRYAATPPTTAEAELHDKMWLEIDEMYKCRAIDEARVAERVQYLAQLDAKYYAKKAQEKEKEKEKS